MNTLLSFLTADFVVFALSAGVALAIVAGPLGSFVVWKKMSYFGETLAHASLLGVALALVFELNIQISMLLVCLCSAFILTSLNKLDSISADTILGIIAHSNLGIVILGFSSAPRLNLEAYLFGALLTVSMADLIWIIGVSVVILSTLLYFWEELLAATVNRDLAKMDGVNTEKFHLLLSSLIALTVAISIKIVGVLLITSLLIIPPATARNFSFTPEAMAFFSSAIGVTSVIMGVVSSFFFDSPVGPSIVVVATILYCLALTIPKQFK
ncbi:MAG: hypothetical protein CMQ02_03500 [Gammaproteobacteria bacterium]|nr:hypothetical protein [Gammaproteobacteria bacterium]